MKSVIVKHSIVIDRHKTSISLEDQFWKGLKEVANAKQQSVSRLVASIDADNEGNLSSALRLFVLSYYRDRARTERRPANILPAHDGAA